MYNLYRYVCKSKVHLAAQKRDLLGGSTEITRKQIGDFEQKNKKLALQTVGHEVKRIPGVVAAERGSGTNVGDTIKGLYSFGIMIE